MKIRTNKQEEIISVLVSNGESIEVNLNNTILVLNEFQKQWTEKGVYHGLIKSQLKKRDVLTNAQRFVTKWRESGLPIIHAPIIQDPANKKGFLANISNAGFFTKDTWKSEFTEGTYQKGDIVLEGRYTFNVFEGSNFEEVLNIMDIRTFFICGFTTSLCIKKTVEAARRKGYNFIIVNDCSATFSGCLQQLFDKQFKANIASSESVINSIDKLDLYQ